MSASHPITVDAPLLSRRGPRAQVSRKQAHVRGKNLADSCCGQARFDHRGENAGTAIHVFEQHAR